MVQNSNILIVKLFKLVPLGWTLESTLSTKLVQLPLYDFCWGSLPMCVNGWEHSNLHDGPMDGRVIQTTTTSRVPFIAAVLIEKSGFQTPPTTHLSCHDLCSTP